MENQDSVTDAARGWVIRLASGEMNAAEHQRLRVWLDEDPDHVEAFRAEQQLWQIAGSVEPALIGDAASPGPAKGYSKARGTGAAGHAQESNPYAGESRRWLARAAAAVLAILALGLFVLADDIMLMQADISTSAGDQMRHDLPDGSIVLLNTDSALAINYSESERRVRLLKGEAFFDVRTQAGRPFRVEANDCIAEAVGTAFAVRKTGEPGLPATNFETIALSSGDFGASAIIPGEAQALWNIRFTHRQTPSGLAARLREALANPDKFARDHDDAIVLKQLDSIAHVTKRSLMARSWSCLADIAGSGFARISLFSEREPAARN